MEDLRAKFEANKQGHLFTFYDKLSESEKSALIEDLSSIDVAALPTMLANSLELEKAGGGDFQPLKSLGSVINADKATVDAWYKKGLEAIGSGKVAVILMAGGQGTRLGSSNPKGMYDIGMPSHSSLFRMQAERLRRLQVIAAAAAGAPSVTIPWYIMTSPMTYHPTKAYFEAESFFGLSPAQVTFFNQGTLPAMSEDGAIFLETPSSVVRAPDGNGGIYKALEVEGVLADMAKRGISSIHTYCVDNALVKLGDPTFVGYCLEQGADCGSKVIPKAYPQEAVGCCCLKNGAVSVVEYSELPKEKTELRGDSGELLFSAANIANHYYSLSFLQRMATEFPAHVAFHIARKKIAHIDPQSGEKVTPTAPNGIKLEGFIFDVFPLAEKMAVLEAPRAAEFAPVKNAPGSPTDSPDTARAMLSAEYEAWIIQAGGMLTGEGLVEISPLLSYSGEGLEALVAGKTFTRPLHLKKEEEAA